MSESPAPDQTPAAPRPFARRLAADYRLLARRTRSWVTARLWAQVLIGLLLGLLTGVVMGPDLGLLRAGTAELIGDWLALPGRVFLGLIQMVLIPLVAASIILGLAAGASDPQRLARVGGRFAAFVGATTLFAAASGAALALWLRPGALVAAPATVPVPTLRPQAPPPPPDPVMDAVQAAPDLLVGLVPHNPLASAAQSEMLAVVIFSIFLGLAYVASSNKQRLEPLIRLLEALLEVSMTVIKWAMYLTPYAVFGLTAQLISRMGAESLLALAAYAGVVLAGLAGLLALYLVIVAVFGGMGPVRFLSAAGPVQLLAFSTSSSAAVMPLTIRTASDRLGAPPALASFVIPLGATMNMAGTALYQSIAVIFIAQVAGVDLALPEVALIVFTLVAASIGAPGAPGVSIAILAALLASFGIPPQGLVFVLGIDRLLDMSRTMVNVTGDLAVVRVLSAGDARRDGPGAAVETARGSG
ncbi:MAG: dicarboxylate/amino acid:cation symporter [Maricaulaceae bacterium]|nr:dicarboxylate/amino acid:cation symporter [Maricaulaceae bacterium]